MPDPERLRDSTEIVLPCGLLEGVRKELEAEFAVTVFSGEAACRVIGSPVEIKAASDYLTRQGVSVR